jgi:hypothetical protein
MQITYNQTKAIPTLSAGIAFVYLKLMAATEGYFQSRLELLVRSP